MNDTQREMPGTNESGADDGEGRRPDPSDPLASATDAGTRRQPDPREDRLAGATDARTRRQPDPREDRLAGATDAGTTIDAASRSALADALTTVGDRWTLLLIAALLDGPRRFGDLQEEVSGIAPNVLTQRLRQLERNALLIARPYSERPPRFVYELSAAGQELAGALRLMAGWGARNAGGGAAPRHSVCGTPMEARWWCPTCERIVEDEEGDELHFA